VSKTTARFWDRLTYGAGHRSGAVTDHCALSLRIATVASAAATAMSNTGESARTSAMVTVGRIVDDHDLTVVLL